MARRTGDAPGRGALFSHPRIPPEFARRLRFLVLFRHRLSEHSIELLVNRLDRLDRLLVTPRHQSRLIRGTLALLNGGRGRAHRFHGRLYLHCKP